jgi:hypothetical protein
MKKGIFTLRNWILVVAFMQLNSCAALLANFTEENPADRDRGYVAEESEDDGSANNPSCTGRFCRSAGADIETGRRPANDPLAAVRRAIETRDVVIGMSRREVEESWGEPLQREIAGSGNLGNERWTYGSRYSLSASRVIIFQNGRVAGWHR